LVIAKPSFLTGQNFFPSQSLWRFTATISASTVNATFYEGETGMCPIQDEAERSLLFQRFAQINDLSSPAGVGLGLCVARLLVEVHWGRIWIESKLGHGITLYFSLPIAN
jgi:K+-sensing histidine kinase KdpD